MKCRLEYTLLSKGRLLTVVVVLTDHNPRRHQVSCGSWRQALNNLWMLLL